MTNPEELLPVIERLRELMAKATPRPWDVWRERTDTRDEAVAELMLQVAETEPFAGAVFLLNANGKCPATTGCGPTSEANAALIVEAINALPALLDRLTAQPSSIGKDELREKLRLIVRDAINGVLASHAGARPCITVRQSCDTAVDAILATLTTGSTADSASIGGIVGEAEGDRPAAQETTGWYRKLPVLIEAYQFHNRVCHPDNRPTWLLDAVDAGTVVFKEQREAPDYLLIQTLEGVMRADVDDWIIRGVAGEIYPCKPSIFEATYESSSPPLSYGSDSRDEENAFFGGKE